MTQTAVGLDIATLKSVFRDATEQAKALDAEVAERRRAVDEEIARLNAAFNNDNAELLSELETVAGRAQEAEDQLRSIAVQHYETTGEKSLDENLGVQVRTKLIYDNDKAVQWAETNAPIFIQKTVDKKAFEKIAETLDFVTTETSVSAVIRGLK